MTLVRGGSMRWILAGALAAAMFATALAPGPAEAADRWLEWGGPNRDFFVDEKGLAKTWPDEGPKKLWRRELGEGYSGILVEPGRLYTMSHQDGQEAVVCLDAATGETLWKHEYEVTIPTDHERNFGVGPRSTPLLAGDRIYACGMTGILNCLDKKSGKPYWSHDLTKEFNATVLPHGYASSPILYNDTIIVPVGGEGHGFMAFGREDGAVRWAAQDFANSYSSPKLITVDGKLQLICGMGTVIAGINPDDGKLEWNIPYQNTWKQNVLMPIWGDDNLLFISAPEAGSKVVKLMRRGRRTVVGEVWSDRKITVYHGGAVRVGDYVYGSHGTTGPAFFFAVNATNGEMAWKERLPKATLLNVDGRFIILDEEGSLHLATATPEALTLHASVKLLEKPAWTVPTLAGGTLYLRDLKTIMALDLR